MVWRGWRDFLNLNNATAEAKAKRPLYLGEAATSGTIENVGASAPAPKRWGQNQWGLTLAVVTSRAKAQKTGLDNKKAITTVR